MMICTTYDIMSGVCSPYVTLGAKFFIFLGWIVFSIMVFYAIYRGALFIAEDLTAIVNWFRRAERAIRWIEKKRR